MMCFPVCEVSVGFGVYIVSGMSGYGVRSMRFRGTSKRLGMNYVIYFFFLLRNKDISDDCIYFSISLITHG